jgi:hypothetical protein
MEITTTPPNPRRLLLGLVQASPEPRRQAGQRIDLDSFHAQAPWQYRDVILFPVYCLLCYSILAVEPESGKLPGELKATRFMRAIDAALIPDPLKGDGTSRSVC